MANISQQAEAVVAALELKAGQGYANRAIMVETVVKTLTEVAAAAKTNKKPGPQKGSVPKVSAFRVFQSEALEKWAQIKKEAEEAKVAPPHYLTWMGENISAPWAEIKADKVRLAEYQYLADAVNAVPAVPVTN